MNFTEFTKIRFYTICEKKAFTQNTAGQHEEHDTKLTLQFYLPTLSDVFK